MIVVASTVRVALVAAGAIALASAPVRAQAMFEGKVTMTFTSPRGAQPVEMYLKDGKSRMEMVTQRGSIATINDPVKKEMIMIMPDQNMFMRRSTDMPAMANMPGAPERTKAGIKKTGKTETIAGVACEHYTITEENGDTDACLAAGMGGFMGMGGGMGGGRMGGGGGGGGGAGRGPGGGGGGQMAWSRDLEKGMFPLKVMKDGAVTLEVTAIEKKKLDPALFAAPEGFTEMPGMGGPPGGGRPPQL